jgi:thiol:disulfide interchange protein DsbA
MIRLLAVLALLLPLGLHAQEPAAPVTETQYEKLPVAVRTTDSARIEVVEVFWYGCQHCFHLEPLVSKWEQAIGKDIDFQRSPAMWNQRMAIHAQAFYTAQALGVLARVHGPLFNALNVDRNPLETEQQLAALFSAHGGVKPEDFHKAFNSFGVQAQVKQADARARSYGITGTPEFVINGKYRVSTRTAGSPEAMFKVIDFLVARERAEKSASKESAKAADGRVHG